MRPIHLQISGLQSYREVQEIDFTALTEAGVFGIFGPTGSGKSTILDAITLALFGKVERASGGTQAIMNQSESTLSVSFTFELGSAEGVLRYRVDRQFKRTGDVSVQGSLSRLIHLKDGETLVLADKAGDVNQQVQAILGLSMADFTRAVVLPQGKFAEFLTLTGKDRRAMLQRLFHLEPYGDRLSAKTASRYKETDVAIKELQAEQQGLGDASTEALGGAETRLREAREAARTLRERLAACERRAAELRAVRELQRELAAVAAREASLAAQTPHVAALEARLARAAQAERLRPLVRRLGAAAAQLAREREAAAAIAAALAAARGALAQAQEAHAAAREALAAQEAPLVLRLEQLRQAAALAAELAGDRERLAALAAEAAQLEAQLAAGRAEQARERELREKALQRQAQLQAELKRAEVPSAYRRQLQEALQEKREWERLEKQAAELDAELRKQQSELERLSDAKAALKQTGSDWIARGTMWLQEAAGIHNDLNRMEHALASWFTAIPQKIAELRALEKAAELGKLAEQLAAHLHEGEACPVCGATEHPHPIGAERLSNVRADGSPDNEVAQLEQLQQQARELQLTYRQQLHTLQTLEGQLRQVPQPLTSSDDQQKGQGGLPNPGWLEAAAAAGSVTDETSVAITAAELQLKQLILSVKESADALVGVERQIQELQSSLQHLLQEKRQADQREQELHAREQAVQSLLAAQEQKHVDLKKAIRDLQQSWPGKFSDFDPNRIVEEAESLQQRDRLAEELRERLEKSVDFLAEKQEKLERWQLELGDMEKLSVKAGAERHSLELLISQKGEQLRSWIGEHDATALASEAQAKLTALRELALSTAEKLEAAQASMQQCAQRDAAARQAAESAVQLDAELQAEWAQQSAAERFASVDEVSQSLLSPEQQTAWQAETEAHRKLQHQLAARRHELEVELNGREVSEDTWSRLEAELKECKEQDEAALQATAKAERDWEELQAKHMRWSELESQRSSRQQELSLLAKLQAALRGNAFVEFLAEEQLLHVSRSASERLGQLTRQKYAIEVDSGGGFVIRDDANGGVRRPVTTLSGGETFLTSLSLALALSAQIQLKGQYPLEFFFLDEGFGTLDQELLEAVITALEKLHLDKLTVGVISHVPELRARLPRRLVVQAAEPGGKGSRISLETM
ncbi:AAA family ATPase [Paenibacillus allorhizosphaerae]|uniref:AAA family ATPase n=1 Tax=Paenibacillus allorhizosphaerae TaxID=2849866 RepID=UPI00360CDF48